MFLKLTVQATQITRTPSVIAIQSHGACGARHCNHNAVVSDSPSVMKACARILDDMRDAPRNCDSAPCEKPCELFSTPDGSESGRFSV